MAEWLATVDHLRFVERLGERLEVPMLIDRPKRRKNRRSMKHKTRSRGLPNPERNRHASL